MKRRLSLAPATVPGLSPPEFVSCAARAGYSRIALRLVYGDLHDPVALLNDAALLRETRRRLREEGIAVSEIEVIVLDEKLRIADCEKLLQVSAEFGSPHIVVCGNDNDLSRTRENFAGLSVAAAAHGLRLAVEFVPYMKLDSLRSAWELVREVPTSNVGILIDAIHFDRAGHCVADIASVPGEFFPYVQLCDAPAGRPQQMEEIVRQARQERLYPGEGGIDVAGILKALPEDMPISLEVPHLERMRQLGPVEHARRAAEHTIAMLHQMS